jgi:hypothetical protein
MRCQAQDCDKAARFQCVLDGRYVMLCEDCRTALMTPYRQDPGIAEDAGQETEDDGERAQGEREG